jgi:hypothetical protein
MLTGRYSIECRWLNVLPHVSTPQDVPEAHQHRDMHLTRISTPKEKIGVALTVRPIYSTGSYTNTSTFSLQESSARLALCRDSPWGKTSGCLSRSRLHAWDRPYLLHFDIPQALLLPD